MSKDTIYRQAAIEALADMHCKSDEDGYVWIVRSDAWARIDALPSAQPEIIYCKDCRHNGSFDTDCPITWNKTENDYCSFAERMVDD